MEMEASICARNDITYHTLMIWFCKIKRLAEAEEIFDQMEI
jgi:pentatricopeptide repeat protein